MDFSKLQKLTPPAPAPQQAASGEALTAIIRVKQAGYRPANVKVRANIDDFLFTAELRADELPALEADPGVQSASLTEPLPLQKLPEESEHTLGPNGAGPDWRAAGRSGG